MCMVLRPGPSCKIIAAETLGLHLEVVSDVKEGCEMGSLSEYGLWLGKQAFDWEALVHLLEPSRTNR